MNNSGKPALNQNLGRKKKKFKAALKTVGNSSVEIEAPAVAFLRPSFDAAFLKKSAHMRKLEERFEVGRSFRVKCPRESHAELPTQVKRRQPLELLEQSSVDRLPELLPIRYGRMTASPFAFFRGSSIIMASDLAQTPTTDYAVQACGDCHLLNFGAFATPERHVVFDINDFDETFPAPWEWDLKRLVASFQIACEHNGYSVKDTTAIVLMVGESYRDKMLELAYMPALSAWYSYIDYQQMIELSETSRLKKRRQKILNKELHKDSFNEFVKFGHLIGEQARIKDRPPLIFHHDEQKDPDFKAKFDFLLNSYRESLPLERRVLFDRYQLADTAIKVVGVGSVGTYCAIGLFFASEYDSLILQFKEARQSVLEPFVQLSEFQSNGERIVFGQRLMQAASDIFLGHAKSADGKHFYVRQLRDVKIKSNIESFSAKEMSGYAKNCGWALAMAHARSADPAVISGYIGKKNVFANALVEFAKRYAELNLGDFKLLAEAVSQGRIQVQAES